MSREKTYQILVEIIEDRKIPAGTVRQWRSRPTGVSLPIRRDVEVCALRRQIEPDGWVFDHLREAERLYKKKVPAA